ncbi:Uncharacterised protein [Yersinia enterocolitica]|nr:Uncharacterised protein [Yersinia enterocolitica]
MEERRFGPQAGQCRYLLSLRLLQNLRVNTVFFDGASQRGNQVIHGTGRHVIAGFVGRGANMRHGHHIT